MSAWDAAYEAGESNNAADWENALSTYCALPDGVDPWAPTQVAQYIGRLQELVGGAKCEECGLPLPGPHRGTCSMSMMRSGGPCGPCGLCGRDLANGHASVDIDSRTIWLCHPFSQPVEEPSCYVLWTVHGRRPSREGSI
jgi:hypothetical protein